MLTFIDKRLNQVTMYRVAIDYLAILIGVACITSFLGFLPYKPIDILIDTSVSLGFSLLADMVFSKLFHAVSNRESVIITALILVLIIPVKFPVNITFLASAAVGAMGIKYFPTIDRKHIFNPAAAAVAAISLISTHAATWWIGTPVMLPFVFIGGLLLIRKIQREKMVLTFFAVYFALIIALSVLFNYSFHAVFFTLQQTILESAIFFFVFVMLIEPASSPTTQKWQNYYAALVAVLYATPHMIFLPLSFTPEIALSIGNIFSYIVSPKYRLLLPLYFKKQLSSDTILFGFSKPENFTYTPGQYMEWTLPHTHTDSRGIRRYFSIASSPTENEITILIKFYTPSSSYKTVLKDLREHQTIIATELAGDFVLPNNLNQPLVFIAGGVGIAPFRSMIKYITDKKITCDIIVLYSNRTIQDITCADILDSARYFGVKIINILTDIKAVPDTWQGERGHITESMIKKTIPDFEKRHFYISGPQLMVQRVEQTLKQSGVHTKNITVDFFPGYTENN